MVKKKISKNKDMNKLAAAEKAIEEYEELKGAYYDAKSQFTEDFPEAQDSLNEIHELEHKALAQINTCKLLVRDVGESVGDFKVTKKKTSPGYRPELLVKSILELEDESLVEVFRALAEDEVLTGITLDKETQKLFFARNPDIAEALEDAWDEGGQTLTPAVKVPKL